MTGIVSTIQSTILSKPPTAILGGTGTATSTQDAWGTANLIARPGQNLRLTLSGALTAATYKEIVAVTGAGVLNFAGVYAVDTTSRDIYIKVLIDGVQVVERSILTVVTTGVGPVCVGSTQYDNTNGVASHTFDQIPYTSSLSIQIKSSLTETDKLTLAAYYRTV